MSNLDPLTRQLDPASVGAWVFDLDNTLYPARSNLFVQVSERMTLFIQDRFDLDRDNAKALQRDLFRRHGTTMRGLMTEHGMDPIPFLDFVHDIDVTPVDPSPELDGLLARLPGRKVIFTNGSVPHAERVMARLGVARHFDHIHDIVAAEFTPKPDPATYRALIEITGIQPSSAVMVEDMAKNLLPAHDLGMGTVWLKSDFDWAQDGADQAHVHHVGEDLVSFLRGVLDRRG